MLIAVDRHATDGCNSGQKTHSELSMIRKSLFLFLTITLLCVPVLLIAHTYTHFAQTEALIAPDAEGSGDADLDEVCLECLALTTLNVIILYALLFKGVPIRYRLPSCFCDGHGGNPSFTYDSRAPPLI